MNDIEKAIAELGKERNRLIFTLSTLDKDLRQTRRMFQDKLLVLNTAISALEKQLNGGWIPVSERLPECEEEVLILTERNKITTAMYEDGKMPEDESMWNWYEIDFDYDEENDINYVPKGWFEYRHFNPDDVYNNSIDEKVIAWQPLPPVWKGNI